MTGRPCPEGCQCGHHHPHRIPAPVPYVQAVRALARWDAWRAQHEKEDPAGARMAETWLYGPRDMPLDEEGL